MGLLAELPRKNCQTIAEHAGDRAPDGMQHLLSRARWDADGVRDDVRSYVVEHSGDPGAVLVVDETRDVKCFQTAKNETGLDHYQVRRYDAWYRHVTLALLAHAYLAVTAATAPKSPGSSLIPVTLGEVRRLLAHLITTAPGRTAAWAWSNWRRHHQHRARVYHYQRRQANYNEVLLSY